jgi:excisionase family DNA binding protein
VQLTMKKKPDDPAVMTVEEAGVELRLGRNAAYAAAARGEIPTIRIGRLLRVPTAAFNRMLEQPPKAGGQVER